MCFRFLRASDRQLLVVHILEVLKVSWSSSVLWILVFAQALHALTFAAHHSACIAMLSHHFPGRLRGRGQALYTVVAYGTPGVIAGLLGGLLSDHFGLASVFWAASGMAVLASLCAYQVWRLRHHSQVAAI